jgi:hypothetical protein
MVFGRQPFAVQFSVSGTSRTTQPYCILAMCGLTTAEEVVDILS